MLRMPKLNKVTIIPAIITPKVLATTNFLKLKPIRCAAKAPE